MPTRKTRSALAGGTADDVEAAFYEALQSADIELLMACWADDDEIVCVHPGGPRIVGPGAIRATFDHMFGNGRIQATPLQVRRLQGLSCAVHSVMERVEVMAPSGPASAYVLATNVYLKTPQCWRMVAHHASPGSEEEAQDISEPVHHLLH